MKFVEVKELPKTVYSELAKYHRLEEDFEYFMSMNTKYAKVEFSKGEYKTWHSAYYSMRRTIKHLGLPITVKAINYEIYLIRRDI